MGLQTKYFLIAVIGFGSIGIWLPIGIEALVDKKVTFHNIPPNVTTYFVTMIFAGCIDYFLSKLRSLSYQGLASVMFNLIGLNMACFALVVGAIILNIYSYDGLALLVGIVGVIVAYVLWWIANIGNPHFSSDTTLGGDPNRALGNG